MASFKQKLDEKSLEIFNEASRQPFSQQCVFFLNAFWEEYGDQAEYIYGIAWDVMKKIHMKSIKCDYVHLYQEGHDLDFDMGLHFFEMMYKVQTDGKDTRDKDHAAWFADNADWKSKYEKSFVDMQTSIVRKKALRDSVDVNFDGRVGMLEYLLYQYNASPKDLITRSTETVEPPELIAARNALNLVNKRIADYEAEKTRLEEASKLPGVKGLRAKNQLAQLDSSPLLESLRVALIKAEAAVRKAMKMFGKGTTSTVSRTQGACWWMDHDLNVKKAKYGRKK